MAFRQPQYNHPNLYRPPRSSLAPTTDTETETENEGATTDFDEGLTTGDESGTKKNGNLNSTKGVCSSSSSITDPRPVFTEHPKPETGDPGDTGRLLYTNLEVDITRYQEPNTRSVRLMKVTKVTSPHEFITEFERPQPLQAYKDWREGMQDFYKCNPARKVFQVKTKILLKYRCYAYYDEPRDTWERVRMMKYDINREEAEVYLFEYNEFRIVPRSRIMELNPIFSSFAVQGFPTHLLSIQPVGGGSTWSQEAVKYFCKLVRGKVFRAVVITRTPVPFPEGFPEFVDYLGVAMVDLDQDRGDGGDNEEDDDEGKEKKKPLPEVTLAAEMVRAGFAEASGFLAGWPSSILPPIPPRFNLDFYATTPPSLFSTPGHSCDPASYADGDDEGISNNDPPADPIPTKDEILRTYAQLVDNAKMVEKMAENPEIEEFVPAEMVPSDNEDDEDDYDVDDPTEDDNDILPPPHRRGTTTRTPRAEQSDLKFNPDLHLSQAQGSLLPRHLKNLLCQIRFSYVTSPSVLYIQLEKCVEELRLMETAISLIVNNRRPLTFDEVTVGMSVACLVQLDRFHVPAWVRAVITEKVDKPNTRFNKVILVDYGMDISIKPNYCRDLPKFFKDISSFAFRAHLDIAGVTPLLKGSWPRQAADTFRSYMITWNAQIPIYYGWVPRGSGSVVRLREFGEQLVWDPRKDEWVLPDTPPSPLGLNALYKFRNEPMIKHHMKSIGINCMYEIFSADGQGDFRFESIGDVLLDSGFVVVPPEKKNLHVKTIRVEHHKIVVATVLKEKEEKGVYIPI